MYATICGRFCLNNGGAAGCVNQMRAKSHAKWGVQIAGVIFQIRSRVRKVIEFSITLHFQSAFPIV